jgi:malonate transporter and related proteins
VAYFAVSALVWISATLATRLLLQRPASDAPSIAMATCFGNTVMLGVPLSLTAFGPDAATPVTMLVSVDTPLLWLAATLHAEGTAKGTTGLSLLAIRRVLQELVRNPIIMAVVLGLVWRSTGLTIPTELDQLLALLGQAAVPTALTALGLTLSSFKIRGEIATLAVISSCKLLLFPALVWLAVTFVVPLPTIWASVAVLCAAMPTGANAYLFAARYDRVVNSVSASVVVTTVLAAVTITALLYSTGQTVTNASD